MRPACDESSCLARPLPAAGAPPAPGSAHRQFLSQLATRPIAAPACSSACATAPTTCATRSPPPPSLASPAPAAARAAGGNRLTGATPAASK
eukprot:366571-Chlamydomonas_euryale.AAC.25